MLETIFLFALALIWIIFATIQDIRTTEVANWISFSLMGFAMGFRFFYSLFSSAGFSFFYQGLIGLAIFFILGNIFYYGKMFAGGDAKLFIALGAVLPISENFSANANDFMLFMLIFLVVGGFYSLAASARLCLKNSHRFKKEFGKQFRANKSKIIFSLLISILFIALGYVNFYFIFLGILTFTLPYLYLYAKAVDEAAMIKEIDSARLREGDWLYRDVRIGKKTIKATWDGLSKKEIMLLRKHKKKIWIREGIAFTPVFFITFLIFSYFLLSGLRYSFW